MISQLLQEHKKDLWRLIIKNNSTKSLLKQMDGLWKKVEVLLQKDLKQIMKGGNHLKVDKRSSDYASERLV